MSIETRSVVKRRRLEEERTAKMNIFELIIYRFDCLVVNVGMWIYNNLIQLIAFIVFVVSIVYIHVATDSWERLIALTQHRKPILSDPPKNVSLIEFLGLNIVADFVYDHKVLCLIMIPILITLVYWNSHPNIQSSKKNKKVNKVQKQAASDH
jgi:uncharacterized membrane protein